jgi:hypothetical protein
MQNGGRLIVSLPDECYGLNGSLARRQFDGLRKRNMVALSTPDGRGSHECLVNCCTGKILGITYNNRAEKMDVLKETFIPAIADIIGDYAWPMRLSPDLEKSALNDRRFRSYRFVR